MLAKSQAADSLSSAQWMIAVGQHLPLASNDLLPLVSSTRPVDRQREDGDEVM